MVDMIIEGRYVYVYKYVYTHSGYEEHRGGRN